MISFKEFLSEKVVGKDPDFKSITMENAIRLVKDDCSIYKKHGFCFYRGEINISAALNNTGFAIIDPSLTTRKSQNTSNYYTIIFDNHPEMKDFPKRSHSFIASTSKYEAEGFTNDNSDTDDFGDFSTNRNSENVYTLIPFDGVKIGFVNKSDIWDIEIGLFGKEYGIENYNYFFKNLGIKQSIQDFIKFDKLLKDRNPETIKKFKIDYKKVTGKEPDEKVFDNFLQMIWDAYSPKKTGMQTSTAPNCNIKENSEVWIGGKCIAILDRQLRTFMNAYGV